MDEILWQYSYLWIAAALTIMAGLVLLTRNPKWRDILAFGVIFAGLVSAWLILHPKQTPLLPGAREVQAMIGQGTPVLLEFQSPYCIYCTIAEPIVDALEKEMGERLRIIHIDVQGPIGRDLAEVYDFEYTPTFIFFDAQGQEMWRQIGGIDVEHVRMSVAGTGQTQ